MKPMRNAFTKHIIHPINLLYKGISPLRLKSFMERDHLSREEIMRIQRVRLTSFARYAYRCSPYYKRVFDRIGFRLDAEDIYSEIRKVPPVGKNEIKKNIEQMFSTEFKGRKNLIVKATGGSTGIPMVVYGDVEDYRENGMTIARQRNWVGWSPGLDLYTYFGGFRDHSSWVNRFAKRLLLDDKIHNVMDAAKITYDGYARELLRNPPSVVIGYFSALKEIARSLQKIGRPVRGVKLIMSCAEPIEESGRNVIEAWFGTKVYSQYGNRELGTFAQECKRQDGYHYAGDTVFCEILDEDGDPATRGDLTITYMGNRVVPLIRYRTGDAAVHETRPCPCGLPFPRLMRIEGRISSVFLLKNGTKITTMFFPHLLKDYPWIVEFQAEQIGPGVLNIRVKRDISRYSDSSRSEVETKMKGLVGQDTELNWIFDEPFIRVPTGKHIYFISRLSS